MRLIRPTVLTLALALALPANPAEPNAPFSQVPQPSTAPTLQVYSRETLVDVTVTDAQGHPVHGLTQSDFTVTEDGAPQPIRSFKEFGNAAPAATGAALPKLPPDIYTNLQPPPASSAINILLLDFVETSPGANPLATKLTLQDATGIQHQLKQEAIKYVQQMPAGTQVCVLAMVAPGKIRLVQALTTDRALLTAAIDALEYSFGSPNIQVALDTLNQLAAVAAQIEGRKNLIWLTYGLVGMTDPLACPFCDEYAREFHRNVGLLADEEVTLYPIEARGAYIVPDPLERALKGGEELASLETMAEAGGGVAYYDSNDLATGIAQAVANGSDFYTLTYVPPGSGYDGRRHGINVRVARPGVHLTYRTYYYAEDPAKLLPKPGLTLTSDSPPAGSETVRAAMVRGMPASTQLLFDVKVNPATEPPRPTDPPVMGVLDPKLKHQPLTRYGLLFALPTSQITLSPGPGGTHSGSVTFAAAAYDTNGKLVTSLSQTIQLPLSAAEYRQFLKSPFQYYLQLDLPPSQLFLRIGVFDGVSNKVGTLEIPVKVANATAVPTVASQK
jgi:VWFA-related protein